MGWCNDLSEEYYAASLRYGQLAEGGLKVSTKLVVMGQARQLLGGQASTCKQARQQHNSSQQQRGSNMSAAQLVQFKHAMGPAAASCAALLARGATAVHMQLLLQEEEAYLG